MAFPAVCLKAQTVKEAKAPKCRAVPGFAIERALELVNDEFDLRHGSSVKYLGETLCSLWLL
jgi:hypothetical protein